MNRQRKKICSSFESYIKKHIWNVTILQRNYFSQGNIKLTLKVSNVSFIHILKYDSFHRDSVNVFYKNV